MSRETARFSAVGIRPYPRDGLPYTFLRRSPPNFAYDLGTLKKRVPVGGHSVRDTADRRRFYAQKCQMMSAEPIRA